MFLKWIYFFAGERSLSLSRTVENYPKKYDRPRSIKKIDSLKDRKQICHIKLCKSEESAPSKKVKKTVTEKKEIVLKIVGTSIAE